MNEAHNNTDLTLSETLRRTNRWHYFLVAVVAAVVVFWNLPGETLDDHECKLALAARTMAEPHPDPWIVPGVTEESYAYNVVDYTPLHHWLVPVENGRPRLVKTPLPYWATAGLALTLGMDVNTFTARLPSAIATVLLVIATLALGRRMFSPRAALMGAIMLAVCAGVQKWGRNARPEMLLTMFCTAAMAFFYFGLEARTRGRRVAWMAAFWITMGLANLAKEFVPLLLSWPLLAYLCLRQDAADNDDTAVVRRLRIFLIATGVGLIVHVGASALLQRSSMIVMAAAFGLPMLWYFVVSRAWKQVIPLLPTAIPGVIVMFAMFLPWMWYMEKLFPSTAGGVFSSQVGHRTTGTEGWTVDFESQYFQPLIVFTLPWLAFLPGALAAGLMKRFGEHRRPLAYLLLWCVGIFALFTAAAAKREHYILPMIPAACLLMGFIAEDVFFKHRWIKPKLASVIGIGYGIAGLAIPLVTAAVWYVAAHPEACLSVLSHVSSAKRLAKWTVRLDMLSENVALWRTLFWAGLVGGALMVAAGIAAQRRRFQPVVGFIAAAIVVIYIGFWSYVPQWDTNRPVRQFAEGVADIVGDATVYHIGDSQAKTAFYAHRVIPAVHWPFWRQRKQWIAEGMGRELASEKSIEQMDRWLADRKNAEWVIAYRGNYDRQKGEIVPSKDHQKLTDLGYTVRYEVPTHDKKSLIFALYHRTPTAETAPATTDTE